MNETRGNARTKPMKRGELRGEKNSLKDSEKTNDNNLYTYRIIQGIIHTFDELYQIQRELALQAESLDLMLIRQFYFLADKCLIIIGPDSSDHLHYYYMSHEDYWNMRTTQKDYIKRYY